MRSESVNSASKATKPTFMANNVTLLFKNQGLAILVPTGT